MNKFWSPVASGIEPYTPGEQPKERKYVKLNTNENPYPPSPKAVEAFKSLEASEMRLYPDPECASLRAAIASVYGVKADEIFVGNGSDEVLAFCFPAFFAGRGEVVFTDLTYSFYPVFADLYGVPYKAVPLNDDFSVPIERLVSDTGVIIANPNAPTSVALPASEIEKIVMQNPDCVVIVDEAYVDFGAESVVRLVGKYPNLLVVQTMSKSRSLAGLRIGYAIGDRELIGALNAIKNSFNSYTLDRAALRAAEAAVLDTEYFAGVCGRIIATRDKTVARLREIGFDVPDSKANFMFVSHSRVPAERIFAALREKGVLVRYWNKPRISNRLRITVGTDEEMDVLIRALEEIVSE